MDCKRRPFKAVFEREISQGTVIYGIRSEKYPTTPCYGIIITARCDIAQGKVSKYHYLVGVDASAWLCSRHGYLQIYRSTIKDKRKEILQKASNIDLDGETLLSFSRESLDTLFESKKLQEQRNRKKISEIEKLHRTIEDYYAIAQINASDSERGIAIQKNQNKQLNTCGK